jgi:hypothetical protein
VPISAAKVLAVQGTTSIKQEPVMVEATTDTAGKYAMTVPPGAYQLCTHNANLYLNPCQWGGAPAVTITAASPAAISIKLAKGARLVLRVHDSKQVLKQVESVHGDSITPVVTWPAGLPLFLPIASDNGRTRDYAATVPANAPLRLSLGTHKVTLSDRTGAGVNPQGIPFQASPPDSRQANAALAHLYSGFPQPDSTVVHVYTPGSH